MNRISDWQTIDVSVDGLVAWLRFNRPDRHNAVSSEMVIEVCAALRDLSTDPEVTVVVLTGRGATFCPGADLQHAALHGGDVRLPGPEDYRSAQLLHEMPQVTLAAINGGCAGAGFAWASACDLRVASDSARFSTSFLEVGLAGELGLAWRRSGTSRPSREGRARRRVPGWPNRESASAIPVRSEFPLAPWQRVRHFRLECMV